eukprot:XP_011415569.1 PREDICTED: perlucin-like protein [Crassostrea gigas]
MKLEICCFFVLATAANTERACDNGWLPYKNHCYWFSPSPDTFHYAVIICSEKGSKLLEIKDATEEKWVLLQSRIRGYSQVWIGLTDVVDDDEYVFPSSGFTSRYSNWDKEEPGGGTIENCVGLQTKGRKWHDYLCTNKFSYACKPAKHFV